MRLPASTRRERFVFVLDEEPFGFWMEIAWMAVWNANGAEEWCEFAVRMEVAGAKRYGTCGVADQVAGSRSDRGDPLGNVMRVADRG